MKSGFVQLIVRNRLAGKPLAQVPPVRRYQPVDSFKKYITDILPNIEEAVEIDLLKKCLTKIQSPLLRMELVNSYLRRLFRMRLYQHQEIKSYKVINEIQPEQIYNITDPTLLKSTNEHSQYDIGSYALFSNDEMGIVFKNGCFGKYDRNEWGEINKFGVMIRRESLAIAKVMKILQHAPQKYDWETIYSLPRDQRLQFVDNQDIYPILFEQLSRHLYSKVSQFKHQQTFNRIWGSSVISDAIINSVLQGIEHIDDAFGMIDQAIEEVIKMEIPPSALDFVKRYKELPTKPILKIKSSLPYYCQFGYTTPSYKSIFLGGLGGTGRSMILTYISMCAYRNKWIVINVPDCIEWTQDPEAQPQRMYNGLFVIQQHAVMWLEQFLSANAQVLKGMKVKQQLYGKCDITGMTIGEYQPVPNLYDPRRETYFNDVAEKFSERTFEDNDDTSTQHKMRITDVLSSPNQITDIIKIGIDNPTYATCAMGEALKQIYDSDKLILECVDSYSWLYRASRYPSFRYFNDRGLFGHIPPYHIAHCRMFVNLDGHKLKRGLKVVAASNGPLFKHHFNIDMISLPKEYQHRVPNLSPEEWQKAARYNILSGYWEADLVQRGNPMYTYTLCQGNWRGFQEVRNLGHYF